MEKGARHIADPKGRFVQSEEVYESESKLTWEDERKHLLNWARSDLGTFLFGPGRSGAICLVLVLVGWLIVWWLVFMVVICFLLSCFELGSLTRTRAY